MSKDLHEIQSLLDDTNPAGLTELFLGLLQWGRPKGSLRSLSLSLTVTVHTTLRAAPVAQLGGLPVLRIDWPGDRLPSLIQRREVYQALAPTDREHLLCYVADGGRQKAFVWARRREDGRVELRTLPYESGTPARTTVERLAALAFSPAEMTDDEPGASAVLDHLNAAFDVEAVTRRFFAEYDGVFDRVKAAVTGLAVGEARHLWTQRLFNRLMFVYFVQRKGWLSFDGDRNYLRALFDASRATGDDFLNDRLHFAFFHGLSAFCHEKETFSEDERRRRRGRVPYLNGGLFDREDEYDDRGRVALPDAAFAEILELFERYNFTVTESTLFDVEVAVDPEMLGKVFEELVTRRNDRGAFYTPRPIVAYMCREALKYHLGRTVPDQTAIARFVDEADPSALPNPEAVLDSLRRVRVCDPACGSGAYLLGMMQELLRLRAALFDKQGRPLDPATAYGRKLEVIQNNLYGVDLDPFAVDIARLRLWLSLAIDYDGEVGDLTGEDTSPKRKRGEDGPSLALRACVTVGDLTGEDTSPKRKRGEDGPSLALRACVTVGDLTGEDTSPKRKRGEDDPSLALRACVTSDSVEQRPPPLPNLKFKLVAGDSLAAPNPEAAADTDRNLLAEERGPTEEFGGDGAFDWRVKFVEVFRDGGFDVVLANPPYVRSRLVNTEYRERRLKPVYPEVYKGTADIYVFFYARAQQLLRPGGVGCFISSNKWLRADYGKKLLQHLVDRQAFRLAVDFGELPVFETAATFPAIFLWQKLPRDGAPTHWAVVKDLQRCYDEGIRAHVSRLAEELPAAQFVKDGDRFLSPWLAARRARMRKSGGRLGELLKRQIFYGIKTGLNRAFLIDAATRARLAEDGKSGAILKPLLRGDDVRRYEAHFRERYLIFTRRGVDIDQYPAVRAYLEAFRADLTPKRSKTEKRGRKPGAYEWYELQDTVEYYEAFERPKILYPVIGKESRFVRDDSAYYSNDKTFLLPTGDWYLVGVLNSKSAFEYLQGTCSVLGDERKGGRLEFRGISMETLPIPDADRANRAAVARLAEEAQRLHAERRRRVERFLRDVGLCAADLNEKNRLERPWALKPEQFAALARGADPKAHASARAETQALTARIEKVAREIDRHVEALYGLG